MRLKRYTNYLFHVTQALTEAELGDPISLLKFHQALRNVRYLSLILYTNKGYKSTMLQILYVVEHERADYERRIQAYLLERSLLETKKKRPNLITYLIGECIRLIMNSG